jgi:hypothetical protein
MKKNLLRAAFVAAFGLAVNYTAYTSQRSEETFSDVMLENVEALASGESGSSDCDTYCPIAGNGCILVYTNGAMVTCPNRWK